MSYLIEAAATARFVVGPRRSTTITCTEEEKTDMTGENLRKQVLRCAERAIQQVMCTNEPELLRLNLNCIPQRTEKARQEDGKD